MLDELTHDLDGRADDDPGGAALRRGAALGPALGGPGGGRRGRAAERPGHGPDARGVGGRGHARGGVPGEHHGVPVVVREARGISAFSADTRE